MSGRSKQVTEIKPNEHLGNLDEHMKQNEKLIHSICYRFTSAMKKHNLEYEDIFQMASIGYMKAYERFDPTRFDVKFSTYCVPMMIGEVQRYLRDDASGGLRVSRTVRELFFKITKESNFGKSVEELAKMYGVEEESVKKALDYKNTTSISSMNETVFKSDGDEITIEDQLSGDTEDETTLIVRDFISKLPERERKIAILTMDGLKQQEIADQLGVTQVQISRLLRSKIAPMLKRYLAGEDMNEVKQDRTSKRKRENKPVEVIDVSKLDVEELAKFSIRRLIILGFSNKEILAIKKDVNKKSVYYERWRLNSEKRKEENEEMKQVKHESIDAVEPIKVKKDNTEKSEAPKKPAKSTPGKKTAGLDYELARKILTENINADRKFIEKETDLSGKQISDMRWRLKSRDDQIKAADTEKKLEVNIHASSTCATKKEVMSEFAKIMETLHTIGADTISYYVTINSPSVETIEK